MCTCPACSSIEVPLAADQLRGLDSRSGPVRSSSRLRFRPCAKWHPPIAKSKSPTTIADATMKVCGIRVSLRRASALRRQIPGIHQLTRSSRKPKRSKPLAPLYCALLAAGAYKRSPFYGPMLSADAVLAESAKGFRGRGYRSVRVFGSKLTIQA